MAMPEIPPLYAEIAEVYSKAPDHAKGKIDKYDSILKACEGIVGKKDIEAFVAQWNPANPGKRTSYPSIMRMRKEAASHGAEAFRGQYGKNRGRTCVPDEAYQFFKALWMTDHRPANEDCWQRTYGWALERGYDMNTFPKVGAFMRRLENDVPENARCLARYGYSIYNRKFGTTSNRDYGGVLAGECWVADHTT
jgi:hypothetical protein